MLKLQFVSHSRLAEFEDQAGRTQSTLKLWLTGVRLSRSPMPLKERCCGAVELVDVPRVEALPSEAPNKEKQADNVANLSQRSHGAGC